jgi:hypothetical protein
MSSPNSYDVGNQVTCSVLFTNSSNAPTDPTTITLRILPPGGPTQVFTYAASQLIRTGTGAYYYNFPTTLPGPHYYRFEGTGTLIATADNSFIVTSSPTLGN